MKRITVLLLLFLVCPVLQYAYGADYEKMSSYTETYVNPFYQDQITKEDIESDVNNMSYGLALMSDDELEYVDSIAEASAIMRHAMTERAETVTIYMKTSEKYYTSISYTVGEGAVAHTGVPDEGDYLLFHFAGWSCNVDRNYKNGIQYYTLNYKISYYTTAEQEEELAKAIEKTIEGFGFKLTDGEPKKIKTIYDYITQHVTYDHANQNNTSYSMKYTAYAAFLQGTANCTGYANLFYRMMLTAGVDCRIITGQANGGLHAWNIVRVGNQYYNMDPTWDAGKSTYDYFMKSDADFVKHERGAGDGNSSTLDFDYTTEEFYRQYPMHESDYDGDFTEHSHYYDAGTLFSEATCTENGSVVYRCIGEDCDDYYFGVINAKGHSWNEGEIIKEASCSETGEASYICLVCGESKTDVIAALGHTEVVIAGYEATCTDSGLSDSSYCSVCDAVLEEQTEIAPLGHTVKEIVTPATLTKDGSYHYVCSVCDQAIMTTASGTSISHPASFTLSKNSYTYDGKVKNPTLTIKDSKGKVISSDYYKIQKTSGRKKVGTYSYKITFQGLYSGSKTISFKINPKGTSIASISKKSKGFTVKWKKLTTQTTGYQIRYSTSSKMTNTKTATISKNTTVSKTVSKLKSKKRYYVQVRTYKTVSGKKYYSDWSATKYVVTK